MGISHFSGLFVLLCVGVGGALLTLAGEHGFYQLVLPHIRRRQNLKYWLHTSQVRQVVQYGEEKLWRLGLEFGVFWFGVGFVQIHI